MDRIGTKIFILAILAIICKLIENSNKMRGTNNNLTMYYEIFNINLSMSLGILGLAWTQDIPSDITLVIFCFMMAGIASKGVFSDHEPESWSYLDKDMLVGLYLPNGCGLASVSLIILYNLMKGTLLK
jgi:hypothetical protein